MAEYTGFQPQRPFGSFIEGLGAGQQFQYSGLRNEASRYALEQQRQQRETAKQFQETGDPRVLRGYDPALAVNIENSLATMDTNKQAAAIKKLTAGIDITDKALPYIVAASKSNPAAAANMWPEYVADLEGAGIQVPPFMKQYSTEAMEGVLKQKEDIKTAVARINAASRMGTAQLSANARLGAAELGAASRLEAAKIGAASRVSGTGRGGTGSNRSENFTDYLNAVRNGENSTLPADATYDTVVKQFNRDKYGGREAGKVDYPKPPKPLTPTEEFMHKALNPEKQKSVGQPGVARVHVIRNKNGEDVTNKLSDSEYQQVLKAKGLR